MNTINQWSCYHGVSTTRCEICFSGVVKGFLYHSDGRQTSVRAGKRHWFVRFGMWLQGWRWMEV